MAEQRDDAWLKAATPEEVVEALDAGELKDLLAPLPRSTRAGDLRA